MFVDAHREYLEGRVLNASPMELVHILYEIALQSVENASRHLADGDAMARSREVTRAQNALTELMASLNHEAGGTLSENLAQIYSFLQRHILDAHIKQSGAGFTEAKSILTILAEAWSTTKKETSRKRVLVAVAPDPERRPADHRSGYWLGPEHYSQDDWTA